MALRTRLIFLALLMAAGTAACGGGTGNPSMVIPTGGVGASNGPGTGTAGPGGGTSAPGSTAEPGWTTGPGGSTSGPIGGTEIDAARLATGETPAGWVEVLSVDGGCRQAVPGDWYVEGGIPGQPLAPDMLAASRVANDGVQDWLAYTAALEATYLVTGYVVTAETDRVFLMRSTTEGGGSWVLSLKGKSHACGIVLHVDEVAVGQYADTSVQILYTLAEK